MLPALAIIGAFAYAAFILPGQHRRAEDAAWAALLQEARDCTAARDAED